MYAGSRGLPTLDHSATLVVGEQRAGTIADLYDALPVDDSDNPAVKEAYLALVDETNAQYAHAVANGMTFTPWTPLDRWIALRGRVAHHRRRRFVRCGQ